MRQIESVREREREREGEEEGRERCWESSAEEEEEGEARSCYSNGRSSPRFLRGQKFTVVLISPFRNQSERVSGCWGNFDPF